MAGSRYGAFGMPMYPSATADGGVIGGTPPMSKPQMFGGTSSMFGFGSQPWRMPMFNPQPFGQMMPATSLPGQINPGTMPGMQQQQQQAAAATQPTPQPATPTATPATAPTTQQQWLAPGQQPANPTTQKSLTFDPATYGYYDMAGKWYSPDDARAFMGS